jgi:hypothetical protein
MKRAFPATLPGLARLARLALVGLLLASACTEEVGTSVRVSLVYKDSWNIASADVVASKTERSGPIAREILVLVPDDLAGTVLSLEIWGRRDGERIARGSAVALPRKGDTVGATIVLERLPCGESCEFGEVRCQGNGVQTCEPDTEDCAQWGVEEACPSDQKFCSAGVCSANCSNECVGNETQCDDTTAQRTCGEIDDDSCRDLGPATRCTGTQKCFLGQCRQPCVFGPTLSNVALADTAAPFDPSIVIDAAGTIHAVYSVSGSRVLRYARRALVGGWTPWVDIKEGITSVKGERPSLATDSQGGVHLAFFFSDSGSSSPNPAFKYGKLAEAGTGVFATVKSGVTVESAALAVDGAGAAHMVYYDAGNDLLYYAKRGGGVGAIDEVVRNDILNSNGAVVTGTSSTAGGSHSDIALVEQIPHLSFYSGNNNIVHAKRLDIDQWVRDVAASPSSFTVPPQARTSIAVDSSKVIHIAYMKNDSLELYKLGLTSSVAGWTDVDVDDLQTIDTGAAPDLVIDPFDGLHIAYQTVQSPPVLQYAYRPRGATVWELKSTTPSVRGNEPTIASEPTGAIHILSGDRAAGKGLSETIRSCP